MSVCDTVLRSLHVVIMLLCSLGYDILSALFISNNYYFYYKKFSPKIRTCPEIHEFESKIPPDAMFHCYVKDTHKNQQIVHKISIYRPCFQIFTIKTFALFINVPKVPKAT